MAPRAPADRFLFHAFLALLLWMPLPFGSNVAWASSLMEAWVFLIAGLWLVQYYRGRVSLSRPFVRAWPVTACLLATVLWIVVQGLPLPAGALGLLSPRALEIHNTTHSYPSLSLDVHATRQAALQTLAYLLFFCLTLLLVNNRPRIKLLAQALIVGGVFQAAYGSLMTLSGLEHGIFIDKQDAAVATGTFINRNHLAGYLEMCLATGVGLMLAELSSTRAAGWRDSARDPARQQGAREARARHHGHGPRAHALAYGQHGVLRKPDRRGLFLPAGRAQALGPHHHLLREPPGHRSARGRQLLRHRESGAAHPADFH